MGPTIQRKLDLCLLLVILIINVRDITSRSAFSDLLEEGHTILKRFAKAENEFSAHAIADVFYEKEPDTFHRLSKRDLRSITDHQATKRIRLDLSSGSTLHLHLRKRSLFAEDTQFLYNTEHGLVKRATPPEDCYASGAVEVDGKSDGTATVSVCRGLHGTAVSDGTEYYIQPVDGEDGGDRVHVLSRRATREDIYDQATSLSEDVDDAILAQRYRREAVTAETYKNATSFVIELAIFVDAKYYALMQTVAAGREDEFILISMAGVQAVFGDREKVGYDVHFKVKMLTYWIVDPEGYDFQQSLGNNLKSFCQLTTKQHPGYDMHFLHTGVTKQGGPAVGIAYLGGVCKDTRCVNTYSIRTNRVNILAHEIGHNLGFSHHIASKCPDDIKALGGGIMGEGSYFQFSACNKWELENLLFAKGKGQCLFEEKSTVQVPESQVDLPAVLPGQYLSPDELCRYFYGNEYQFYRPFDLRGEEECLAWMCINLNEDSTDYLRVIQRKANVGYTCGDEMFCNVRAECSTWENPVYGWDVVYLRANRREVTWSEWPTEWSSCSAECGTGVQIKKRHCEISEGVSLSPHCRGESVQAIPCNTQPCDGDTDMSVDEIRQEVGDKVCARFLENNVDLLSKNDTAFLATSKAIRIEGTVGNALKSKSCMLMCARDPERIGMVDAIYPDGTPCTDSDKPDSIVARDDIDLRCVQGVCAEMADCPGNVQKDLCGVCGGDPIHCKVIQIDPSYDVPEGERSVWATMPAGTRFIDVAFRYQVQKNVKLELWTADGQLIFGRGGLFPKKKYMPGNEVEYAGTKWTFSGSGYLRADGPTDRELVVKAVRNYQPIKEATVIYLAPQGDVDH